MDQAKRSGWDERHLATAGAQEGKRLVIELMNHFQGLWDESVSDPNWKLRSSTKLKNGVDFIDAFFRAKVVAMSPSYGSVIAGLFPSCSPDEIKSTDFSSSIQASGWESVKCTLVRAKQAFQNPVNFYKANRCTIWKNVVDIGGEALLAGLMLILLSNPVTGMAVVGTIGSGSMVARYFVRYLFKATGEAARGAIGMTVKGIVEGYVTNFIVNLVGDITTSLAILFMKWGVDVQTGNTGDHVMYEPEWIGCLKEYIELGLMVIIKIAYLAVGDASDSILDVLKCLVLKGIGCETDKSSCWTLAMVSNKCLPGGGGTAQSSNQRSRARQALEEELKPVWAKMASDLMAGKTESSIEVEAVNVRPDTPATAATCYTKCQVERLEVSVSGSRSGTSLRCVGNAVAPLDSDFDIQVYLKCNGMYRTGPLDGSVNDQVVAALVFFQECFGLAPDGLVGGLTAAKMRAVTPTAISACSTNEGLDGPRRSRRQDGAGGLFTCEKNKKFSFANGIADYQRWLVCNNFIAEHPMDGVTDRATVAGVRSFQHLICWTPADGAVTTALEAKMMWWKPGKVDDNCRSVKGYGLDGDADDEDEEEELKCVTPNKRHPLNDVRDHKIWFNCNNIGPKQKLSKATALVVDNKYHECVKALQSLKKLVTTGVVDFETKLAMWAHGSQEEDTTVSKPLVQAIGDKILNKLPERLWGFRGGWQWSNTGGGGGNNPYFSADHDVVVAMTFQETREMFVRATAPNDEGESFISPDDEVFELMNTMEFQLDTAFKASECSLFGDPDASRLRAVALARGLDIEGSVGDLEARIEQDQVAKQAGHCSALTSSIRKFTKNCCRVMPLCTGVSCHVPINYIFASKTVKVWVRGIGMTNDEQETCEAGGQFKIEAGIQIIDDDAIDFEKTVQLVSGKAGFELLTISLEKVKIPMLNKFDLKLRVTAQVENLAVEILLVDRESGDIKQTITVFDKLALSFIEFCDDGRVKPPSDIEELTLKMVDTQLIAHGRLHPLSDVTLLFCFVFWRQTDDTSTWLKRCPHIDFETELNMSLASFCARKQCVRWPLLTPVCRIWGDRVQM
jgi:hypothetical protein